jgi:tRNA threonylcarbamoyladenosine dehydratase
VADPFSRTRLLVGEEALARLGSSAVAVVGLGGVGSWAAEALARAGVGSLVLIDDDSVSESNINRQLVALRSTLGRPKVEVMAERIRDINPDASVGATHESFCAESAERLIGPGLSYIVDAIDGIAAKVELALRAKSLGIPIVSVMGTGMKLDPARLEVADLFATSVSPLARVMRRELGRRGVKALTVVYSKEEPHRGGGIGEAPGPYGGGRRSVPGSISFVPSAAGLLAASVAVRSIIGG